MLHLAPWYCDPGLPGVVGGPYTHIWCSVSTGLCVGMSLQFSGNIYYLHGTVPFGRQTLYDVEVNIDASSYSKGRLYVFGDCVTVFQSPRVCAVLEAVRREVLSGRRGRRTS